MESALYGIYAFAVLSENSCVNTGTVRVNFPWSNLYLTIRLWPRDFYEVIVDEAEGRINFHLIEIESE